ncbi:MAG TPA: DUF802 domain-containing protein [Azospira sp.]|nr:DUF802 domain-containing protein [Azospira sp.]HNN07851.1 DUF802 domain-containing protein [Azospira sp.]HNN46181.1 DUF802 domain-containing protein [Azospira sp.]
MNSRNLSIAAFTAGLSAVGWIAAGYALTHPLAFTMTLLIGAIYVAGAMELRRFDQDTSALRQALADIPSDLATLSDWLLRVPASLQNVARLRIDGERIGLPGPAVTPYLVGLLVMLGMLGTFLGMTVTLNGAVMALESTTDLQTIRATLAAPVKGLGLAFGTSVAGVAASAMLGLISSLCRRERLQAGLLLDTQIAGPLRRFSLAQERQETWRALQAQGEALPAVVDKLQALMTQMEARQRQLDEHLLAGQEQFHRETGTAFNALAQSVEASLRGSLADSARLAGEQIVPAVQAAMDAVARDTRVLHEKVTATLEKQLDGLATRFDGAVRHVEQGWTAALAQQAQHQDTTVTRLREALDAHAQGVEQRSTALLAGVGEAHAALQGELAARDEQRMAQLATAVETMAGTLQREWQAAGAETLAQQQQICRTLEETARSMAGHAEAHATRTIDEIARLMQTAAEAPRVAAEVIGQLRQQLSDSMARDNALLDERSRIMATLDALLAATQQSAADQRSAIEGLVASAGGLLEESGRHFAERTGAEAARIGESISASAAQITGSAVEMAALGDAFAGAVAHFGTANERLLAGLARIEESLEKSLLRSDEQLAYTVAQARELIDLSLLSQQRLVADLQRLGAVPAAAGALAEAAA